jgi:putative serine protease XkdF
MPIIEKSEAKERIVWGEVYSPLRPDADGEYIDADQVRAMSYRFMQNMALNQIDNMDQRAHFNRNLRF